MLQSAAATCVTPSEFKEPEKTTQMFLTRAFDKKKAEASWYSQNSSAPSYSNQFTISHTVEDPIMELISGFHINLNYAAWTDAGLLYTTPEYIFICYSKTISGLVLR